MTNNTVQGGGGGELPNRPFTPILKGVMATAHSITQVNKSVVHAKLDELLMANILDMRRAVSNLVLSILSISSWRQL